jgi:hypothetical protein
MGGIGNKEVVQFVVDRPTVHATQHIVRRLEWGKQIGRVKIDFGPSHDELSTV